MSKEIVVLALLGGIVALIAAGMHQVPEGFMAVYYSGGALVEHVSEPGWRFMPFWYSRDFVQLTMQTDTVRDVPCGTSTGVIIYFDRIDVVNQLDRKKAHSTIKRFGPQYDKTFVFDKIAHEINQFCSVHTLHEVYISKFSSLDEALASALQETCNTFDTGLTVVSIRVTKINYEKVEAATSELQVAAREQEVTRKREETERMKLTMAASRDAEISIISAEREANVTIINTRKLIEQKKGESEISQIQNHMMLEKRKAETDSSFYAVTKEAEAMAKKLSEAFLRYTLFTSLANSTKIYFGPSIPNIFLDMIQAPELTKLAQEAVEKKKQ